MRPFKVSRSKFLPKIAGNTHSVVVSAQTEDQVADYVASHLGVFETIGAFGDAILEIFNKIVDIDGYVDVEFADGSTARFELTGLAKVDGDFVFEFELQSAKDSDGNNIPTSADEIIGERRFTSEGNLNGFIGVADFYGVETEDGGCGSVTAAVCVGTSAGVTAVQLSLSAANLVVTGCCNGRSYRSMSVAAFGVIYFCSMDEWLDNALFLHYWTCARLARSRQTGDG